MNARSTKATFTAQTSRGPFMRSRAGWSEQRVEETILHARDLRHKGSRREQEKYAHRTVRMAIRRGLGRTIEPSEDSFPSHGVFGA